MAITAHKATHNQMKKIWIVRTEDSHIFSGEEMDRLQTAWQVLYTLANIFYSVNYMFGLSIMLNALFIQFLNYSLPFTQRKAVPHSDDMQSNAYRYQK